jgi:hypothetical protein
MKTKGYVGCVMQHLLMFGTVRSKLLGRKIEELLLLFILSSRMLGNLAHYGLFLVLAAKLSWWIGCIAVILE